MDDLLKGVAMKSRWTPGIHIAVRTYQAWAALFCTDIFCQAVEGKGADIFRMWVLRYIERVMWM